MTSREGVDMVVLLMIAGVAWLIGGPLLSAVAAVVVLALYGAMAE